MGGINNAGFVGHGGSLSSTTADDFYKQFNVHGLGALWVYQASVHKIESSGFVLNISSRFGAISRRISGEFDDIDGSYSYRAAKAAQNMLTASITSPDVDRTPEETAKKVFGLFKTAKTVVFYSLFEGDSS